MKTVRCNCGRVVTGRTGDELLAAVEGHIHAEHRPTLEAARPDDVSVSKTPNAAAESVHSGTKQTRNTNTEVKQ